jgi:tRNA/rRNA methyltransferase
MAKPVEILKDSAPKISNILMTGDRVGIMFGRESSGLSNEEINLADAMMTITTNQANSSLNLSQAACLVAYEVVNTLQIPGARAGLSEGDRASKAELLWFFEHLEEALSISNFFQVASKKKRMMLNIRNTIIRMQPSKQDISTLQGIIKALTLFYPRLKK